MKVRLKAEPGTGIAGNIAGEVYAVEFDDQGILELEEASPLVEVLTANPAVERVKTRAKE